MTTTLSDRSRAILKAAILEYIHTVEPVSSGAIAARYTVNLSPATIRKVMADLEAGGYLYQPHTSAGRVPTEKSFRLYVDTLLETEEPRERDMSLINTKCNKFNSLDEFIREAAKTLSTLTHCAGFVLTPGTDRLVIRDIRLVRIDGGKIMVVVVSAEGHVHTRAIEEGDSGAESRKLDLEKVSNYLNSLGVGMSLTALRERVVEEMRKEKNLYDELLRDALRLGVAALTDFPGATDSEVYVEGTANFMDQPELAVDMDRMKLIFEAFEEKGRLVKILDRSLAEGGVRIWIGSESQIEAFEGLSFVTAPYGREGESLGTLGVIGPVSMDYPRIIPLVDFAAGFIGKSL